MFRRAGDFLVKYVFGGDEQQPNELNQVPERVQELAHLFTSERPLYLAKELVGGEGLATTGGNYEWAVTIVHQFDLSNTRANSFSVPEATQLAQVVRGFVLDEEARGDWPLCLYLALKFLQYGLQASTPPYFFRRGTTQKRKIVRPNQQSNLRGSCQSNFSLPRHHSTLEFAFLITKAPYIAFSQIAPTQQVRAWLCEPQRYATEVNQRNCADDVHTAMGHILQPEQHYCCLRDSNHSGCSQQQTDLFP